jgi:hypothetical protein
MTLLQARVAEWMAKTFTPEIIRDIAERNHRFLEESLELAQSLNCTQKEAHMLVDYVFGRPIGEPKQEVGGAMVTLAALCNAADMDIGRCFDDEMQRCWLNIERIRAKQKSKPPSSPLPGKSHTDPSSDIEDRQL